MLNDIKKENLLVLKSKIAIVTGGSKGIGLGVASRLAEAGAHVVIADIDGTTSAVDTLKSNGYSALSQFLRMFHRILSLKHCLIIVNPNLEK
jgi:S-adenosylhomocysteine hydrolase